MCAAGSGLQSDLFFLRPINNTDDFVMTDLWTFLQNFNDKMTMMGDSVHRYQVGVDIYTYLHLSTTIYDPRPWLTSSPSSSATSRGRRRGTRGTWSTSRWSSPSRWWWYDEDVSNDDTVAQEVHSGTMKEMETRFTTLQAGIVNIGMT